MIVATRRMALFLFVAATACTGPSEPQSTVPGPHLVPLTSVVPFVVSNAVSGPATAGVGALSSSLVDAERVFISAPPGTFPGMASANVHVDRTGTSVVAALLDGGFDPVAAPAHMGDTLTVLLTGLAGSSSTYRFVVPGKKAPLIVRTVPPRNKRDVPLNARMMVVFSEPIDPLSLTAQNVSVRAGTEIVPGTLSFTTPDQTTAEFTPSSDLRGATDYELVVSEHVTDRDGTALGAPERVPFTTAAARIGAGVLKSISRSAGDRQSADAGTALRVPLAVLASDAFGTPVAGLQISFKVISGGGSIDGTPITTNAAGIATSSLMTLGAVLGDQQVEASTAGLRITFTVFARRPLPSCVLLNCPGSRLAFVRGNDIYSAFADGSNPIRLARGSEPAWSSDGRIAFTGDASGVGVYVMNEDGSNVRLVAPGGSSPAWSPDARRLAYVKRTVTGQSVEAITVDVNTGSPVRLGFDQGWNAWPTWLPDGSSVAFVSDWLAFDFAMELFLVDREGGDGQPLTNGFFGNVATWPSYVRYDQPAWSPDGMRIALMQCPAWQFTNCDVSSLIVMNADGTGVFALGATHGYVRPSWSPNGKWITYEGPTGIRFISVDGREQGVLIPNASGAAWRP